MPSPETCICAASVSTTPACNEGCPCRNPNMKGICKRCSPSSTGADLRDHGYPDMGEKPVGIPKATKTGHDMPCPNCQCQLMQVEVKMEVKLLKGGKGTGMYLGCPACPFASPMMTRAG